MNDFLPVTKIPRSGLPPHALVCGDPRRAALIAERLTDHREIGSNREYVTYRGTWQGVDLTVSSHGVGGAGAICMFEELALAGSKTIIRVGTCGAMHADIQDGELIISTASIREDGVTHQLIMPTYPAFSTPEVVIALQQAARAVGHPWYRGVNVTHAVFYPGVISMPWQEYMTAGVISVEMELSALLVMASLRGLRAGGILVSDGNMVTRKEDDGYNPHRAVVETGVGKAIEVALNALVLLAAADASADADRPHLFR